MAFLKQTLTLSTVGASLITSNSFWFFDFFGLQTHQDNSMIEQISESTPNALPSIQTSSRKSTADMNKFSSARRHTGISGSSLTNENLKTGTVIPTIGVYITLNDLSENKEKFMAQITSKTLGDFTLTLFTATEEDYQNFPKEKIKISLFSQAAWYSSTGEDEYSLEVNETQIKELFEGQDEAKVKQLLLSLHKRLDWKKYGQKDNEPPSSFNSELIFPRSLDPLNDLKIKYFRDFDSLKDYVHKKVTTCVGEEIACIADYAELDIMDTDKPSFFDELEKSKII